MKLTNESPGPHTAPSGCSVNICQKNARVGCLGAGMSKGRVVKHIGVVGSRHRSVTSRWGVLPYESSCEPRYKELALFHEDCGSHWGISCVEEDAFEKSMSR